MKEQRKKILLIGLGIGALGALGFFTYRHFKELQNSGEGSISLDNFFPERPESEPDVPAPRPAATPTSYPTSKPSTSKDAFPLKQGSRGENVRQMQQALISAHGPISGGADGIFGKGTAAALKKAGYPETVNESTFYVIVGNSGGGSSGLDPMLVARSIHAAASAKNLPKVIEELKKLKNTSDYSMVSEVFKNLRIGITRYTLVNGLLTLFTSENDKQQIRIQFTRMGLKYDGKAWSLSGIDAPKIITVYPGYVWRDSTTPIEVPANMVLGVALGEKNGYTVFQSFNNQQFLVQSNLIKPL